MNIEKVRERFRFYRSLVRCFEDDTETLKDNIRVLQKESAEEAKMYRDLEKEHNNLTYILRQITGRSV